MAVECDATITFTDDDNMLGDKQHNRTLFVKGVGAEKSSLYRLAGGGRGLGFIHSSIDRTNRK
uniref:Uncharacterized protein n=1 Tax=Utricularia reniformis TaxID=192314 RepID=A0A1Y0B0C6_9LAMI|nr:hypothetical protein AEK19_MT0578 [Utricularia reniformis]ART30834.1 hypothetical protein AEK19_MT0578 [Utricularia reniformis]